ncbi:bifunctional 1-(5-phosphoribosyl)-5-((5-phosphoribosylamino)methylideneamino)imidazole-4-carboxamide isomerase/phosphoribosylanthranilate isomerase PriA [Ornithinimicrobium avium]|uniref:Bifunctional 1-(5-phosphoribosyl)-5-((5-phosphoribosylamino)methylideneamino)imidazole-4-carboxamide isomerase/phosphoribosylanthranilate isomerase PriA n=1 Tax=Ornithinimicrobium avium TaxID=2283195 RepID=A0A345NS16_9MICO|nr:bifunctional 1-(5-phosphoribosyl)-5-((5-phosphoribosylamino)methylideneamino)imidazole-4-carboxamide isomerase/phosphoribosylanthranilate isomerase PriA [Ornithinimicrobium avium]
MPTLLAAVDVAGGRAVQVVDGDDDPLRVALGWVAQGARWIHLVDLDRAYRRGSDLPLLTHLVAALPVPVQLSGGLDRPEVVDQALATGARRINLAVTALRDPGWVAGLLREHGDRVAVGIDVLGDRVVARGSGEDLGPVQEVVATARAAFLDERPGAYVVADARRDGRRTGADLRLFRGLVEALGAPVVASGGVATLADLVALRTVGVSGIVLGSALYHRAFTLTEALEVLG